MTPRFLLLPIVAVTSLVSVANCSSGDLLLGVPPADTSVGQFATEDDCGSQDDGEDAADTAALESGFEDGFSSEDSDGGQDASDGGIDGGLMACSGMQAEVVSVSECPEAECDGSTAYALCVGTVYARCSCTLPPGYHVVGMDSGASDASSKPDASPDSSGVEGGPTPCPTPTEPTAGSACTVGTGGDSGCTYGSASCVCLPSGLWACT
jgi:hypothetical protein